MSEEDLIEIVEETKSILTADPKNVDALFKQGKAYFQLEEFVSAVQAFKAGLEIIGNADAEKSAQFAMWIRKCNTNLSEDNQVQVDLKPTPAQPGPAPQPAPTTASPANAAVRHEWYQTVTHVILSFFIKDRTEKDVEIEFKKRALTVTVKLGDGKEFQHSFDPLYGEIDAGSSNHSVSKTKIELKLKKVAEGVQWKSLESAVGVPAAAVPAVVTQQAAPAPAPKKKDWDKLVQEIKKEEEEEKPEGDAALNKLFQDIFSRGDEKTRMAMQKSFLESGGTVLSTNWDEVGSKRVDGQPPQGMEFKKWD
eukprot:TRINITY_DN40397_c0_g1_i1.p1 TRINITY_DN40397_c0_g1~~TRINITY_DN40397_c0_g1_i1.p1  ORF type:complete len:315 (+),score=84.95 TRINITY_DN40397_c0_g1_i1:22-945(+)